MCFLVLYSPGFDPFDLFSKVQIMDYPCLTMPACVFGSIIDFTPLKSIPSLCTCVLYLLSAGYTLIFKMGVGRP